MFCGNCGKEISDSAKFCPNCGSAVAAGGVPAGRSENTENTGKRSKNFWIGVSVFAAAVVLVVMAGIWLLKANTPEDVIETYVEASYKPDAKAIWELLPKQVREATLKDAEVQMNLKGENEVIFYLNEMLQDYIDRADDQLGEGWKLTYDVVDWEDYDKTGLLNLNRDFREMGLTDFTADAARSVTIEIGISAAGDETMTRKVHIKLVKLGRIWYLGGL